MNDLSVEAFIDHKALQFCSKEPVDVEDYIDQKVLQFCMKEAVGIKMSGGQPPQDQPCLQTSIPEYFQLSSTPITDSEHKKRKANSPPASMASPNLSQEISGVKTSVSNNMDKMIELLNEAKADTLDKLDQLGRCVSDMELSLNSQS